MNIENKINESIKDSMKSKDTVRLESLRAIKSAILLEKTKTGSKDQVDEEIILKIADFIALRDSNLKVSLLFIESLIDSLILFSIFIF